MKKITILCVMAMLCLQIKALAQENQAKDNTQKGIKIGEKVPDITINNLHNYLDKDGNRSSSAKISDFKGKLLILDFWATWCAPCLAMLPKVDSLQRLFQGQVQFLPVTYQNQKEVLTFLEKYSKTNPKISNFFLNNTMLFDDKQLQVLFPHVYLPNYVWIDREGILRATSEPKFINEEIIKLALKGDFSKVVLKNDIKPFIKSFNEIDSKLMLYSSEFTSYITGLRGGIDISGDNLTGKTVELRNVPLIWLYQTAYRDKNKFNKSNTLINVSNPDLISSSLIGQDYSRWLQNSNGWNYKIKTPFDINIFELMRLDLVNYLNQYNSKIETRELNCLVLKTSGDLQKLVTKGGNSKVDFSAVHANLKNVPIRALIDQLSLKYLAHLNVPILDLTNSREYIDLSLEADMSNLESINKALKAFDLKLEWQFMPTSVLIIEDNPSYKTKKVE